MLKRKIRSLAVAGAVIMSAAGLAGLAAAGASAAPVAAARTGHLSVPAGVSQTGYFEIRNGWGNLCLNGVSRQPVRQLPCNNGPNQLWHRGYPLIPGDPGEAFGSYGLVNRDNQCLAVQGGSTHAGALIYAWPCPGGVPDQPDQYWAPLPLGAGDSLTFLNHKSGLYLSVDGCNDQSGALINQWGRVASAGAVGDIITCQRWQWPPAVTF